MGTVRRLFRASLLHLLGQMPIQRDDYDKCHVVLHTTSSAPILFDDHNRGWYDVLFFAI